MNIMTRLGLALLITISLGMATMAFSATEGELKAKFKQRYPQLQALRQQGKVGETAAGYVEAVKPEFVAATSGLVDPENADRRELYGVLAKQTGTTPDAVATRNAARNFDKARSGEWLKNADGSWRQK